MIAYPRAQGLTPGSGTGLLIPHTPWDVGIQGRVQGERGTP